MKIYMVSLFHREPIKKRNILNIAYINWVETGTVNYSNDAQQTSAYLSDLNDEQS